MEWRMYKDAAEGGEWPSAPRVSQAGKLRGSPASVAGGRIATVERVGGAAFTREAGMKALCAGTDAWWRQQLR
ncbi:MAG: hypothetical protein ACRD18_12420 [Terriglobia bacterium]